MISTSTDDGIPIRCELCGAASLVNVSRPPGDSVCPDCGAFLWVDALVEITNQCQFVPDIRIREIAATVAADAVNEIIDHAAAELHWTPKQQTEMRETVMKREELGSTGIGNGIAVPHATVDWLRKSVSIMAFAPKGVDFHSLDGKPVHTVILIASPKSNRAEHLRMLERVSRSLRLLGQPGE